MGSTGLGLLFEEHRTEIVAAWRQAVARELGGAEPALGFAVAPLVRELALACSGEGGARRSPEAWKRCAVLVRSTAAAPQVAREFKVLHRCLWEALRTRGAAVAHGDRGAADEWLDEALAEALDRLERVRLRIASFEHVPVVIRGVSRPAARPPPLPPRATGARTPVPAATPVPAVTPRPTAAPARAAARGEPPLIELDPLDPLDAA